MQRTWKPGHLDLQIGLTIILSLFLCHRANIEALDRFVGSLAGAVIALAVTFAFGKLSHKQ